MRWRAIASGVLAGFGAVLYLSPSFAFEYAVTRALRARPATSIHGHGLVPPPPPVSASTVEVEHEPARVVPDPASEPEPEPGPEPAPASAPPPQAAARQSPAPPPRSAPPVDDLEAVVAIRMESLPLCRRYGVRGPGVVEVAFMPDGGTRVGLSAPYANTAAGACVARRLGAPATPFEGAPVVVRRTFSL